MKSHSPSKLKLFGSASTAACGYLIFIKLPSFIPTVVLIDPSVPNISQSYKFIFLIAPVESNLFKNVILSPGKNE